MTELEKYCFQLILKERRMKRTSQFPGATGPLLDFLDGVPLILLFAVAAHRFEQ
jgi:hypothetical protein